MKKGTAFELFCTEVLKELQNDNDLLRYNFTSVTHDVSLTGESGQAHQTDILCTIHDEGEEKILAVECKDYENNIPKEKITAALGNSVDTHAKPMVIARVGFQKGAIVVAKYHDIDLLTIKKPIEFDFEGRIKNIEIIWKIASGEIGVDIEMLMTGKDSMELKLSNDPQDSNVFDNLVYDENQKILFNLEEIINEEAQKLNPNNTIISTNLIEKYGDLYILINNELKLIEKLTFSVFYKYTEIKQEILGNKVIKAIVTNINSDKVQIIKNKRA